MLFPVVTDNHVVPQLFIQLSGHQFILLLQEPAIFFHLAQVVRQAHAGIGKPLKYGNGVFPAGSVAAGAAVQFIPLAEFYWLHGESLIFLSGAWQLDRLVLEALGKLGRGRLEVMPGCAIRDRVAVVADDQVAFVQVGQFTVFARPRLRNRRHRSAGQHNGD